VATFGLDASSQFKAGILLLKPIVNNDVLNLTLMQTNSDVIMSLHRAYMVRCMHHNGCNHKYC